MSPFEMARQLLHKRYKSIPKTIIEPINKNLLTFSIIKSLLSPFIDSTQKKLTEFYRNLYHIERLIKKQTATNRGKDVILAAKNKRIRELEAEIERLSSVLKQYYAIIVHSGN